MTLSDDRLQRLVKHDNPVDVVWEALWDIWSPPAETPTKHYGDERELRTVELERNLKDIYWELYSDVLPPKCVNEASIEVPEDGAFLVMDAMSVREAGLFVPELEDRGYDVEVDYSFSTVPSETTPYKDRVGYNELTKEYKTATVKELEPSISGDERLVWSRYPDSLLENVQEGKTEIFPVEEAYDDTVEVLVSLLEQIDSDKVVVGSDHGYVREESGYNFPIGEPQKSQMKDVFGSDRFVSMEEANAESLVDERMAVEADGYYMILGRYTTPSRGKYGLYQHGGMSIVECLTPRLEVKK